MANLSFTGNGRVSVPVEDIVNSPRVQAQVKIVREIEAAQRGRVDMSDGLLLKYFVLKPKGNTPYAVASRAAMRKYASSILEENPALAKDLREWADREQAAMLEAPS